jgi:hypothetical protein
VEFYREFADEFAELSEAVQGEIAALIEVLKVMGPRMNRPGSDAPGGSTHTNMKE